MSSVKYPFLDLGPVNEPYFPRLIEAVGRVVKSGRYIGGKEVDSFEDKLRHLCKVPFAIGVSNGLDALRLILRGYMELGVMRPGDEVIVPANTYIASVLAISEVGLTPVLVDPDAATSNLDTSLIEAAITERTRAIMTVHLYGRVSWDATIMELAGRYGLKVIEDNAQAIGVVSEVEGLHGSSVTGGLGDAAAFSFYPTKNVGALGDAGAVTTHDAALASAVRALANYGSDVRYHNIYRGFNCRMDPMQAAVLKVKLPYVQAENSYRHGIASVYCKEIVNPAVQLPELRRDHAYHQFVVHVPDRDAFTAHLDANGVGWDIHYAVPPHLQPCYRGVLKGADSGELHLPVTERLADTCVSLPITRCTSVDDAFAISEIINSFNQH